jgi:hypothetical protein
VAALVATECRLLLVPSFMGLVGKAPDHLKRLLPEMDLWH